MKQATHSRPARTSATKLPVTISHPDKVFWPDEGYTKLDLVEYYRSIFPLLAPYVKDRMLSLERCPDGMLGECFFQKQETEGHASRNAHQADRARRQIRKGYGLCCGGILTDATRRGKSGLHRGTRHGYPGELVRQPDWGCIDIDPMSGNLQIPRARRCTLGPRWAA